MVNCFLPCPELTSGNEHISFELTNVKLHSAELSFYRIHLKMYKYFCLEARAVYVGSTTLISLSQKKVISVDPKSKLPIKILFP